MSPKGNAKIRIFVDANIIVRFLTRDDERKAEQVKRTFMLLEAGRISAETNAIIIAEVVWVLSSFYKLPRETIAEYISLLLVMKNLFVKERPFLQTAIESYKRTNADFIDCFVAACAEKRKLLVCSYDKDFDKIGKPPRIEPEDILKKLAL